MLATIGGYTWDGGWDGGAGTTTIAVGGTGLLVLPPLLMILFRRKYPRWWFDWNRELRNAQTLRFRLGGGGAWIL